MVLKRKISSFLGENTHGKTLSEISLSVGFDKYATLNALYEMQKKGQVSFKQSGNLIQYYPASGLKASRSFSKLAPVLVIIVAIYIAYLSYTSLTGYFFYGEPAISPSFISNSQIGLDNISEKDGRLAELDFDNFTSFEAKFLVNKTGKYNLSLVYESDSDVETSIVFEGRTIGKFSSAEEINMPLELSPGENVFEFVFSRPEEPSGQSSPGQITGFFIAGEGASEISGDDSTSSESPTEPSLSAQEVSDSDSTPDSPQSSQPDSTEGTNQESTIEPILIGSGSTAGGGTDSSAQNPESGQSELGASSQSEAFYGEEENHGSAEPAAQTPPEESSDKSLVSTDGSVVVYQSGNSSQASDADVLPDNASGTEPVINDSLPANDANTELNQSFDSNNETNESLVTPGELNNSNEISEGSNEASGPDSSRGVHVRIDYIGLIPEIETAFGDTNASVEANGSSQNETASVNSTKLENESETNSTGQLEITYSELIQGKIVLNEPVKWTQEVSVSNPYSREISEEVALDVPNDAGNVSVYNDLGGLVSSGPILNIALPANQKKGYSLEFYTSPVEIEIIDQDLSLLDLLPPEARDISVYEGSKKIAYFRNFIEANLDLSALKKKIFVYHNSSLHYYNISVSMSDIGESGITENLSVDTTTNQTLSLISEGNSSFFVIPKLSGVNLTVKPEIETIQQDAVVGEPVKWTASIGNLSVNYETPAPLKEERESQKGKTVVVYSNVSVHYTNITAFTDLPNTTYAPKIYWLTRLENTSFNGTEDMNRSLEGYGENLTRVDISSDLSFNVSYIDNDSDGRYERMQWIVPHLSEQTFEISLEILNVQSYPIVGNNWTVMFTTTGTANLTIRAVNGTVWSQTSELAKDPNQTEGYDLKFLNLTCGEASVNYAWINDSVFVENYSCNETGYEASKVLSGGKHHLEFTFGDLVADAHNSALVDQNICLDGSGADCSATCIIRAYVCDTASFSGCKMVMTDRRGACSDSTAYSAQFDSASCTNWDNGEACLNAGSGTNYFYAWVQHSDGRASGSLSIFNTGNINGDTCQGFCDCLLGEGKWSIGGETAATTCCGDDASEYPIIKTFDSTMDRALSYSRVCCDTSTDCVNAGSCYASGTNSIDADGDGDNDTCSSGTWTD